MAKDFKRINPPPFSKSQTRRQGLNDLEKILKARLELDMKQYKAVKLNQVPEDSEVGCYYKERVQLLRKFIAEVTESKNKYTLIKI